VAFLTFSFFERKIPKIYISKEKTLNVFQLNKKGKRWLLKKIVNVQNKSDLKIVL